jgi:hypothetical protein
MHRIEKPIRPRRDDAGANVGTPANTSTGTERSVTRIVASNREIRRSLPGTVCRGGSHLDDAARFVPEFRRHVARNHVHRRDRRAIRRKPGKRIEPLVHWNPVDDIQEAVVDTTRVKQPVVFSAPPGEGRHYFLDGAVSHAHWHVRQRLAGNADAGRGLVGRDALHGDAVAHGRRHPHRHLDGQGSRHRERQLYRGRSSWRRPDFVATGGDGVELRAAERIGERTLELSPERVRQRDDGGRHGLAA